jgi:hypothetical protein
MTITDSTAPSLTPAEIARFLAVDAHSQYVINWNRAAASLTDLVECDGCWTEVAERVFDDIDSNGRAAYNPVGGSTKEGGLFFGPACSAKEGFSDDERARAIVVTGLEDAPFTTMLGEIADANADDIDLQVLVALRSLLNGAPEATVVGFVGVSAAYRLAKAA